MSLNHVTLDDKYDLTKSRVFVTGYQALVRLTLMQHERDRRAGLNTAGYVTGYRGSPLGGLDYQFQRAAAHLAPTQRPVPARHQRGPGRHRAVGLAAGRAARRGQVRRRVRHLVRQGPGRRPLRRRVPPRQFRRHLEAWRRARADGRRPHRGVLDHRAPVRVQFRRRDDPDPQPGGRAGDHRLRALRLGDVALHRHLGRAQVHARDGGVHRRGRRRARPAQDRHPRPDDFAMPEGGLNIRLGDTVLGMEARLHDYKRDAMLAFVRANKLNRVITSGGRNPKIGVITPGKSYLDVRQALDELGIDEVKCNDLGLRIDKVACPWPLGRQELMEFAQRPRPHHRGRGEALADRGAGARGALRHRQPAGRASARRTSSGNWLFPVKGALDPNDIAICIGERLLKYVSDENLAGRVARLKEAQQRLAETQDVAVRIPVFLLRLPAQFLDRGAGGLARLCRHRLPLHGAVDGPLDARASPRWAARAPTGSARRRSPSARTCSRTSATAPTTIPATWRSARAIASGVNITYKILYNDAVAMTGGQTNDGGLTRAEDRRPGRGRRRQARRRRHRRAEQISVGHQMAGRRHLPSPRRPAGGAEGAARNSRLHGADLRPDLRRREAPAPQARHVPRSRQARRHQRAGLRGLRRLRRAVELRLGAAAARPNSDASAPSTSRPATRTSPASRASARPSSPCTARKLKKGEGVAKRP